MNIFKLKSGKVWKLLLHTIRYLRIRQLLYQVYYRVCKPRLRPLSKPIFRGALNDWHGARYFVPSTTDGKTFTFLGQVAQLEGDWNSPEFPKLWLYNLHYQDDLNANEANFHPQFGIQLIDDWILANPPMSGNGWEPYCISLRIVNWVKFLSRLDQGQVKENWLESLAKQADALEQQIEFHILANHLFANAKALVFVGSYLGGAQGNRWLKIGLELLDREIGEQFLGDGAHYERTPMYQSILLWDIADLIMLSRASKLPQLESRSEEWSRRFCLGLEWLLNMTHPDGSISFFNDATFGIAPEIESIKRYARLLRLPVMKPALPVSVCGRLMQESGYGIIEWPDEHRLLVDVAQIGPDYQPGHAHADTLSCELSLFGRRVLVNSGISEYGESSERHRQRSTSAHNTVEVDGENSSEVWSGFRVARRARPSGVSLKTASQEVILEGSHDGYCRLPGKVKHYRRWRANDSRLLVEDRLTGNFGVACAHWHFGPGITINQVGEGQFVLSLPSGQNVNISLMGGVAEIMDSTWHPRFGASIPNKKLVVFLNSSKMILQIDWSTV
tara:strand:+ start:912 stop:2588 length:1677 start_codon:yes stop_codon:yes gene_type:complete